MFIVYGVRKRRFFLIGSYLKNKGSLQLAIGLMKTQLRARMSCFGTTFEIGKKYHHLLYRIICEEFLKHILWFLAVLQKLTL